MSINNSNGNGDIQVNLDVDTSEIDRAIEKIDHALEKFSQLQHQLSLQATEIETLKNPPKQPKFSQFWNMTDKTIGPEQAEKERQRQIQQAHKEQTNTSFFGRMLDKELSDVSDRTAKLDGKWHGQEEALRRFFRMVPGAREVQRGAISGNQLFNKNLSGAAGLIILAYNIAQKVIAYYKQIEQERRQVMADIMQIKNFKNRFEYREWQQQQTMASRTINR